MHAKYMVEAFDEEINAWHFYARVALGNVGTVGLCARRWLRHADNFSNVQRTPPQNPALPQDTERSCFARHVHETLCGTN